MGFLHILISNHRMVAVIRTLLLQPHSPTNPSSFIQVFLFEETNMIILTETYLDTNPSSAFVPQYLFYF